MDDDWFSFIGFVLLAVLALTSSGVAIYYEQQAIAYNEQTAKYEQQTADLYLARLKLCAKDYRVCPDLAHH